MRRALLHLAPAVAVLAPFAQGQRFDAGVGLPGRAPAARV